MCECAVVYVPSKTIFIVCLCVKINFEKGETNQILERTKGAL